MKKSCCFAAPLALVFTIAGCGDSAQVAEDTGDAAEEAADETGDAAEEVGDEVGDAAEGVGEEAEELLDDIEAAQDCASLCDEQQDCDNGLDEDICYANCEDVAIDGEGNDDEQDELDSCAACVGDLTDDNECVDDGNFTCTERCAQFMGI